MVLSYNRAIVIRKWKGKDGKGSGCELVGPMGSLRLSSRTVDLTGLPEFEPLDVRVECRGTIYRGAKGERDQMVLYAEKVEAVKPKS